MATNSLLPIVGISQATKDALASLKIYDISGLLIKGQTPEARAELARALSQAMNRTVDLRTVGSWLRQADLMRLPDMTPQLAYLLAMTGIRGVADLSRVNVGKILPVLSILIDSHPDFNITMPNGATLSGFLETLVAEAKRRVRSHDNYILDVTGETEPVHLLETDEDLVEDFKSDGAIIQEGLGFLDDITLALPMPHILLGQVLMRKRGQRDDEARPKMGVEVQVSGIVSPGEDAEENKVQYQASTDSQGRFALSLPTQYNLGDIVTITVRQGTCRQSFVRTASEILDAVYATATDAQGHEKRIMANQLLRTYNALETLNNSILADEAELNVITQVEERLAVLQTSCTDADRAAYDKLVAYKNNADNHVYYEGKTRRTGRKNELLANIAAMQQQRATLLADIYQADDTTDNLELTLTNVMGSNTLRADMGVIILTEETFRGYTDDNPRALPSVKLMDNDNQAVMLPTDTAPSHIFNYTMLQRLVEPTMRPMADPAKKLQRKLVDSPIDVLDFKNKLTADTDSVAKMASLGIGYILNMHQAWVPDGYALGSLLYSLILAPGEEQRVVVREKKQSYSVADENTGVDDTANTNTQNQAADTMAAYQYGCNKFSDAHGSTESSSKSWSIGGSAGAFCVGLNGGYSSSSSKTTSNAHQNNGYDQASSAAQGFQHAIKSAAEKISQSVRLNVRTATSTEQDSVASKIVANHNHSHAMTVQYWEVSRRYRLQTCIDGVELVLFVPLQPIQFLPKGQTFFLNDAGTMCQSTFNTRYQKVVQYYDALRPALPARYRTGLDLMQKYAAIPRWEMHKHTSGYTTMELSVTGRFLAFDDIQITLRLTNGKGSIKGTRINNPDYDTPIIYDLKYRHQVLERLRKLRINAKEVTLQYTFTLPPDTTEQDLAYLSLSRQAVPYEFHFDADETLYTRTEKKAISNYEGKLRDLYKDNNSSSGDIQSIQHYSEGIPDAYLTPVTTITQGEILALGNIELSACNAKVGNTPVTCVMQGNELTRAALRVNTSYCTPVLTADSLRRIEATMQHIASETIHYSQVVWASLSDNDRVMLFERYTIQMNFDKWGHSDITSQLDTSGIDIPLLNCVNVKKVVGFYGNCILLPFTYPKQLADKLGKSAAEVQDAIYRYHANNFRVPSTTISLPTNGMIGEAVLGETNVSEEIDLTRFWKWSDSEIDKMKISKEYLQKNSYLTGEKAKSGAATIEALKLGNADLTKAIQSNADLLSALKSGTVQFDDLAAKGLGQLTSDDTLTSLTAVSTAALNNSQTAANKASQVAQANTKNDSEYQQSLIDLKEKALKGDTAKQGGGKGSGDKQSGSTPGADGKQQGGTAKTAAGSGISGTVNIYVGSDKVETEAKTVPPTQQPEKTTNTKQ